MDSILSALKDFLTNIKNLSLPGLLAALGFALLLWPPQVLDVVNDVEVNSDFANENWPKTQQDLERYAGRIDPVCNTIPRARERVLPNPHGIEDAKSVAVANQFNLERIVRTLAECSEKEKALSGFEDSQISAANAEIDVLKKERDGIQETYLAYEKTANPLAGSFRARLTAAEGQIRDKQAAVRRTEQLKRERDRRATELDRLSKDVAARLSEPGRLRPKEKFDDFLTSLSNHIVAFLALALGWSILFEPINRALFGLLYDRAFRDHLDVLYPTRNPSDPQETEAPSDSALGYAYFLALLLTIVVIISYFFSQRSVSSGDHTPCTLTQIDCATLVQGAPPLTKLLFGTIISTAAGILFSIIFSWVWIRIAHKGKERQARQLQLQTVASVVVQALAPFASQRKITETQKAQTTTDESATTDSDTQKPTECEKKLKAQWNKISQPEYAIGQGLLSKDDYNSIKDEYYGQSQISIGLMLPAAFLTFAVLATPQFLSTAAWTAWLFLALLQALLLYVGVDRRHKFETAVESIIASQFLKTCEAKQSSKQSPAPPTPDAKLKDLVRQQLKDLLKGARIGDSTLEVILPSEEAPSQAPSSTEPTGPLGSSS